MVVVVAKLPIVGLCKNQLQTVALIRDFCKNQAAGIDAKDLLINTESRFGFFGVRWDSLSVWNL